MVQYVFPTSGVAAPAGGLFGSSRHEGARNHAGWDFHGSNGSAAVAVIGGTVLHVGTMQGYDHYAVIQGEDGNMYRYATHGPVSVKVGQKIAQGQPVGTIARGHVHFEVARPGDPGWKALKANGVTQWWGKNKPVTTDPAKLFGVAPGTRGVAGKPMGHPVPSADIPNVADAAPQAPTLRKGMSDRSTNGAVSQLQRQLIAAGFDVGKHGADGIYGKDTAKAVAALTKQYGLATGGDASAAGPRVQTALRNQGSVDNIASVLGFGSPNDTTTQPMSPTDIAFGRPVDLGEPSARFGNGDGASPGFPSVWGEQPAPGGFGPPPPSTFPARPERQFSNLSPALYDMPNSGVARGAAPSPAPPMSFAANDIPLPRPRPSTVTMTGSAAGGLGRDVAMGAGSTGKDKWQPLSLAPPPLENDPNIGLTGSAEGGLGRSVNMGAGYDTPGASWASMKGPGVGTDVLAGMKTGAPFEAPGTSINDVLKGVGGIPDALGWQTVKGWFGGEEPVAAKPSITIPYAVPPGGSDVGAGLSSPAMPGGSRKSQQSSIGGFLQYAGGPNEFPTASPGNSIDDDLRIPTGIPAIDSLKNQLLSGRGGINVGAGPDAPANQAAVLGVPSFAGMGSLDIGPDDQRLMYANGETSLDPQRGKMFKSYPESYYSPDYAPAPFGSKGWMMRSENAPGGFQQFASLGAPPSAGPNPGPSYAPAHAADPMFAGSRYDTGAALSSFDPGGAKLPAAGDQAPPAVSAGIPGVTFGDLPAHIPGGFGAPPAAMPTPPPIQSAPEQTKSLLSPTGRSSNGQSYASLGGGGGPGGFNVASNSYAPWAGGAPYAGYMGGGFQGPNGFSNSPFTPGGYTAPDFNPISGGSTYAINKNDRTYVTSDGMGGYRVQSY